MTNGIVLRSTYMSFFIASNQYAATDESVYLDLLTRLRKIEMTIASGFVPLTILVSRFNLDVKKDCAIAQTHIVRLIANDTAVTQLALLGYDLSEAAGVGKTNTMIDHVLDAESFQTFKRDEMVTFGTYRSSTYDRILKTAGHLINVSYPTFATPSMGSKIHHWTDRNMRVGPSEKLVMTLNGGRVTYHDSVAARITDIGEVV